MLLGKIRMTAVITTDHIIADGKIVKVRIKPISFIVISQTILLLIFRFYPMNDEDLPTLFLTKKMK